MTTPNMHTEYRDEDGGQHTADIPYLTDDETDVESQDRHLHIRNASESSENGLPVPVWMRESAKSFKYKWVPLPLRKAGRATLEWIKGPEPPRELRIKPLYPHIQEAPLRLMDKYLPKQRHRICLLIAFYSIWFLTWSLMLKHNSSSGHIEGYGKPSNIWCGASFWNDGNGCGLNGNGCRPFSSAHLAFRCQSNCKSTQLLETHVVGNQSLVYRGLVVGGPDPTNPDSIPIYRGDSFICQAAIHAGVISDGMGGCGVATLTGTHHNFQPSNSHGIQSVGFPSSFPRTFTFQNLSAAQSKCPTDSRWPIFAVTAIVLTLLWLLTTSPTTLFFSTFFILCLHVGFVSDPPNTSDFPELLSILASRLLPASFISFILYRYCALPTLRNLTAQIEKPLLYLSFCFIGALNNYTFGPLIPIQRLTPHDIKAQPGAPVALAIIIISILSIVGSQIHYIRVSGQLPKYLKLYLSFCAGLVILLLLPNMRLRIHHYILAILFMPGTAMQTRPALIYQGLLLGLFVNGVMRWGFASIIQTPAALGERGGGQGGSWWGATSPNITAEVGMGGRNISFRWGGLPTQRGVDGVSVLVGDVERWRGYVDEELYWDAGGVTLPRRRRRIRKGSEDVAEEVEEDEEGGYVEEDAEGEGTGEGEEEYDDLEPEFYRFAWMNGNRAGRYGGVGIWDENGVWIPPARHG